MKKYFFLFLASCSLFPANSLWAAEAKMAVTGMKGDCQILREDASVAAKMGAECQKSDVIKTGEDGQMDVTWNGRLGCRVLPSTELALKDTNRDAMVVEVNAGNIILNVKSLPKESTFRVESPTAVATVRGTQFWGRVENSDPLNPVTTFAVRKGKVEIMDKNSSQTFFIKPGYALDIPKELNASPKIRKALPVEMDTMAQADNIKADM